MLNISLVVGNPKRSSRTLQVGQALIDRLVPDSRRSVRVIDLVDYASVLFEWPSEVLAELNAAVAASDVAVFASPTYKATYTGLLKAFLDRYPADGLLGVMAIPVMTGANLTHSMGPDVYLRSLLVELGASVPTRSLYFVTKDMDRLDEIIDEWAHEALPVFSRLAVVAAVFAGTDADSTVVA
jgi:FMN reductase